MKLPPFEYACPNTLSEAVALLASHNGEAKAIAGGQSLVPMMAFRIAQPSLLVDLRKLSDLRGIRIGADGVRLGALARWRDISDDKRLDTAHPLLKAAIAHVAHYQIRNRGTVGGSLAHADPASEMPGIAVTCDAEIAVTGKDGARAIKAADFLQGALTTALKPDEIITEVRLPAWPAGRRFGFQEFARRRGDFAMAGIALFYDVDAAGKATNAHIGVIGVGDRAHRLAAAEAALNGKLVDEATAVAVGEAAAAAVDPQADIHASAAYRRALTGTLCERALLAAARQ
jgi:carbon-monoxide dehydrogenase medium subunit